MSIKALLERCGGPAAVGRACGVSSQAVSQWRQIPEVHCAAIERACEVPCEQLRPDLTWIREGGVVIAYQVPVPQSRAEAA
jgi:DNA-binding transcriptional regulator YdaS (Cro superfamily)